jgi:uncharacterized MnhB-related membrane protein
MWFVIIFIIDFIVAYVWVKSIQAIDDNNAIKAAITASFMTLSSAITVISFTTNWWLVAPAVVGTGLGTYVSVKRRSL